MRKHSRHRPRVPHIPLVSGPGSIIEQFQLHGGAGLTALQYNEATAANLSQLAQIINVIYLCEQKAGRRDPVIEGGMRALESLISMHQAHGRHTCSAVVYAPIALAVMRCLDKLTKLRVDQLYFAQRELEAMT